MTVKCYRCEHSGLLLPPDYKDNWGKYYGIGLGPIPVSECLNTRYGKMPVMGERVHYKAPNSEFMYAVFSTKAGIEEAQVSQEEFDDPSRRMVLQYEDPDMRIRLGIIRAKQQKHPSWQKLAPYISTYKKPAAPNKWGTLKE